MQIPSNLFLNKFGKPALYLPGCVSPGGTCPNLLHFTNSKKMVIWGIISALTAVCTNAAGLLANRFFLGIVEAAYLYVHPYHPAVEEKMTGH